MIAAVESYLALRRATGYSMRDADRILRSYGRFAAARGDRYVTVTTILDWARQGKSPERREALVRKVALLARHLHAENPRHEIPAYRVFASDPFRRPVPFIFTKQQISQLVGAASRLAPTGHPLRGPVFAALFSLLAATGMRISEALALRVRDITVDGLHIRETKCHKSRLLPLHPTAELGLGVYLHLRRALVGEHVFPRRTGQPLNYEHVKIVFRELLATIGIDRRATPRPRIHCLRHTFAVRSLESCNDRREIAQHQLALSTYLGHNSAASTYWYLEATPQLLASIAQGSERFVDGYGR